MTKSKFYKKCENANLAKIVQEKGYKFFKEGIYNLNIIGIRSDQQGKVTNLYDDLLVVVYITHAGKWAKQIYKITTEPGLYYMTQQLLNPKGTSILAPGQYCGCYKVGKHQGKYDALVQQKAVKVYRDNNKDKVYNLNPKTEENGIFGINIHRSDEWVESKYVNKYSAGCQVFADPNEFKSFMRLCKLQNQYNPKNSFTYTLLEESDLIYQVGDVNHDGKVDIADVNTVISMILANDQNQVGDVNQDGEVNIADVNTILDIIMGNS